MATTDTRRRFEEEAVPGYRPEFFYPVKLGAVIHDRYKIICKLGYGVTSTVWLAEDIQRWWWQKRWVTLKIHRRSYAGEVPSSELAISHSINSSSRWSGGRRYLRPAIASFHIDGPDGQHLTLVHELMRESLVKFQRRFVHDKLPIALTKSITIILLQGLDHLHRHCNVIHTDLKPDNILMGLENDQPIRELVTVEQQDPSPCLNGIYPSCDFGDFKGTPKEPKISDFGMAVIGRGPHAEAIQADSLRAPEVILGAEWSFPADIWNFGTMLWELVEGHSLFDVRIDGVYSASKHLAELIAVLGPPPRELLARGEQSAQFFDAQGKFLQDDGATKDIQSIVAAFDNDEEKQEFVHFMKRMLQWLPEKRSTAQDLLGDPWLKINRG